MTKTCPNCGAPIQGFTCQYCGAQYYDLADISFEAPIFIRARPNCSDQVLVFKAWLTRLDLQASMDGMTLYVDADVLSRIVQPKESLHIELKEMK